MRAKSLLIMVLTLGLLLAFFGELRAECEDPEDPGGGPSGPGDYTVVNNPSDQLEDAKYKPVNPGTGGDPVLLKGGEFSYSATDLRIRGRAMDVVIRRTYGSQLYMGEPIRIKYNGPLNHMCPNGVDKMAQLQEIVWTLPDEAYDVLYPNWREAEFRVPLGGPYLVGLEFRYYWWFQSGWIYCGSIYHGVNVTGSNYNSYYGHGWDMSYNIMLRAMSNKLVFFNGNGSRYAYTKKAGTNEYLPPKGRYDKIVKNQDFTYTLFQKYGGKIEFDVGGYALSIDDRKDNSITFGYDTNPFGYKKLKTITDDLGRKINLTYNSEGLLSDVNDFAGRWWHYDYNSYNHNLTSVTDPNNLTTTYEYYASAPSGPEVYVHGLISITDPNGDEWLHNNYPTDGNEWVESQIYGDGIYKFDYRPDSNKTLVTDRRDVNSITLYDDYGQVLKRTVYTINANDDPNSFTTRYEYDSNGLMTRRILPAGNFTDYACDANGNLITLAREPNNGEPNMVTSFTYESRYQFIKTITTPLDDTITFEYDYENQQLYDSDVGNLMKITLPAVKVYGYGEDQQPTIELGYNDTNDVDTIILPDDMVISAEYYDDSDNSDPNCAKIKKIIVDYGTGDCLNMTYEYKWDAYGNVAEVKDPNAETWKLGWNKISRLTQFTDPLDNITRLSYNKSKMLDKIEREVTGDDNQVVTLGHDLLDNIKTITDPLGYVTHISRDKSENISDVNDAEEHNTQFQYNERDLLSKITDANDNETVYTYTANGDVNSITDANNQTTRYEYDGFDRLVCITYPDDTNEVFGYESCGTCSKSPWVTSFKNRNNKVAKYEYNALGWLTVKDGPGGFNDPNIYFSYDISGRLRDVNDTRLAAYGGGVTTINYDRIGRPKDVNDIYGRLVKYQYTDNRGLRTKLTYPDNSYITYEYDRLGRLKKIKDQNGGLLAKYEYDQLNRRKKLVLGNNTNIVYEYDIANQLTELTNNVKIGGQADTIKFTYDDYDKVGNRMSMQIDDADAHVYTYDELYQLTAVDYNDGNSTSYSYDNLGNRVNMNENGYTDTYKSNELNQYSSVSGAALNYDNKGNITRIDRLGTERVDCGDFDFSCSDNWTLDIWSIGGGVATFDGNDEEGGSIQQNVDVAAGEYYTVSFDITGWFEFDEGPHEYEFDVTIGGVEIFDETKHTGDGTYTITNVKAVNGGNLIFYAYAGAYVYSDIAIDNVSVKKEVFNTDSLYAYDNENRMTSCRFLSTDIFYAYDFAGRRVKKQVSVDPPIIVTKYCYDGDQVIAEYEGETLRKFIYGPGIDEPICMIDEATSNIYYYHYDGLGSVSALSDEDGNIIEKYKYDVFGAPKIYDADDVKIDASGVSNPYMFTGRRYDDETGLYYYRARYYNPQLGRFMSPDPVAMFLQMLSVRKSARGKIPGRYLSERAVREFLMYDPIGRWLQIHPAGRFLQNGRISFPVELNLYIYCLNNPLIYIDPYGLGIWSWIGAAFEATGGGLLGYAAYASLASTAPAWVIPVGVGLLFFGIGNQIGDMICGYDFVSKPPGKGDSVKRSERYEEEVDKYPVEDSTDPGSYYR